MDFFYDGQIRRYVTQFMRIFIGFKFQAGDGEQRHVPVLYGDMSRMAAAAIRENSENKMVTVPKIACYITGLEMDTTRLSDASFVSKVNIRERAYEQFYPADYPDVTLRGLPIYQNTNGANYTVERLMPTPYTLTMKADIWTSSTDQKLQLLEQILVLFNPSLEIQTTDNYIDWTSLSVVDLTNISFTSRTIPQGAESEIDICTIECKMPIYITPPAKVKKLGVVKSIIANVFGEQGDVLTLEELIYNRNEAATTVRTTWDQYGVLLLSVNDPARPYDYHLSLTDKNEVVSALGLNPPAKQGPRIDWTTIFDLYGEYSNTSLVYFEQATGFDVIGTFALNEVDPTYLVVTLDQDTIPRNTVLASSVRDVNSLTSFDAVIDPVNYRPLEKYGSYAAIPPGERYLMLDDVNPSPNAGGTIDNFGSSVPYDGAAAWQNQDGTDPVVTANSIIEWNDVTGTWETVFDPTIAAVPTYLTNLKTGIQYRWDGEQWLRSFEGEYAAGYWRLNLDA